MDHSSEKTQPNEELFLNPSSLYCIYGEEKGSEENLYESLPIPTPPLYDEIIQKKSSLDGLIQQPLCGKPDGTFKTKFKSIYNLWWQCWNFSFWAKIIVVFLTLSLTINYLTLQKEIQKNSQNNKSSSTVTVTIQTPNDAPTYSIAHSNEMLSWDFTSQDWYIFIPFMTRICLEFPLNTIKVVYFQPLQVEYENCLDTNSCLKFIDTYLAIADASTNFSYYVDQRGQIYGSVDKWCLRVPKQLWVAVMINTNNPLLGNPPSPSEVILAEHFGDILAYGMIHGYLDFNYEKVYLNKCIVTPPIHRIVSPVPLEPQSSPNRVKKTCGVIH
ncbi:hypothetical protein J6590_054407 [Homalodisca vitripennis]|nr:hypothetical protein J6590_054407 [Homalodisca vitripennis]